MEQKWNAQLAQDQQLIETYLRQVFQNDTRYADLQEAMEYSLLAGGKRLRPVMALECCRLCGGEPELALPFAAAVEMVHTYSLIHDDLPCMDDDDLRRGRPTNHKVYGEATAVLAGDGLLTAAFQVLAQQGNALPPERITAAVACLSHAAGPCGMVGGQVLDMAGEGRTLHLGELELIQSLKTGALFSAAAELGCIAAGAGTAQRAQAARYAQKLGQAFQIRDDVLDVTSTDEELGKCVGSDQENGKSTFVTALGLADCQARIDMLTQEAVEALAGFPEPGFLIWLAQTLAQRKQ